MKVMLTSKKSVGVKNIAEASKVCRDYITSKTLRASFWRGGEVIDGGKVVARVSYNGRVWGPERWQPGAECLYNPYESK